MGKGALLTCLASGGCREVITTGETGLLVPVGDATAFQAVPETLVPSGALRERAGAPARRDALSRFGLESMAEPYEACYRCMVAEIPVAAAASDPTGGRQ